MNGTTATPSCQPTRLQTEEKAVLLSHKWKQEAFEKCWAHSVLRAAVTLPVTRCRYCRTPAISIAQAACDVHDIDDDNDNAWQRGPLWPHGMGPIRMIIQPSAMGVVLYFHCSLASFSLFWWLILHDYVTVVCIKIVQFWLDTFLLQESQEAASAEKKADLAEKTAKVDCQLVYRCM